MMDMKSRNQYLFTLIKERGYHLKSKSQKSELLNEYCRNTGQHRKHVIRKIRNGNYIMQERKRQLGRQRIRGHYYDKHLVVALIRCWEIFDYPCGQRLESSLRIEIDRLRKQRELICSDEVAQKLKKISARTIDIKLKAHKEQERLQRPYNYANNPLLYQKIPVKLSFEWDRNEIGNIHIDFVEHCGSSLEGSFLQTLSTTDNAFGWWEGGAQLGRGKLVTEKNLSAIRRRYPFNWHGIHSDNDSAFINYYLFNYCQRTNLNFSRSRPYKKNDNCFAEQKNYTHVRRCVGYLRYDTLKELKILNSLYENELRLYKNFFQPVMKLASKVRIGGHIKRKYDEPKTPYQRIIDSPLIEQKVKDELTAIYLALNPARLKREIDEKLKLLKKLSISKKYSLKKVENLKNLKLNSVTFLNCTTNSFR
jgi:hypothetical protein